MDIQYLIRQMRTHCEAGINVPAGGSAKEVLANKENLWRTVTRLSEEFQSQLDRLSRNILEFKAYHQLKEEEPCGAGAGKRKGV